MHHYVSLIFVNFCHCRSPMQKTLITWALHYHLVQFDIWYFCCSSWTECSTFFVRTTQILLGTGVELLWGHLKFLGREQRRQSLSILWTCVKREFQHHFVILNWYFLYYSFRWLKLWFNSFQIVPPGCIGNLSMWWCFCSLKWELVDHLMGSKGWWSKEDLLPKILRLS
jgi:hypothetical protein